MELPTLGAAKFQGLFSVDPLHTITPFRCAYDTYCRSRHLTDFYKTQVGVIPNVNHGYSIHFPNAMFLEYGRFAAET